MASRLKGVKLNGRHNKRIVRWKVPRGPMLSRRAIRPTLRVKILRFSSQTTKKNEAPMTRRGRDSKSKKAGSSEIGYELTLYERIMEASWNRFVFVSSAVVVGMAVIAMNWEDVRRYFTGEVAEVASSALENEKLLNKSNELAIAVARHLIYDEATQKALTGLVNDILQNKSTRDELVVLFSNLFQDPLIVEEVTKLSTEVTHRVLKDEDVNIHAQDVTSSLFNKILAEKTLQSQAGVALWNSIKYAIVPNWFGEYQVQEGDEEAFKDIIEDPEDSEMDTTEEEKTLEDKKVQTPEVKPLPTEASEQVVAHPKATESLTQASTDGKEGKKVIEKNEDEDSKGAVNVSEKKKSEDSINASEKKPEGTVNVSEKKKSEEISQMPGLGDRVAHADDDSRKKTPGEPKHKADKDSGKR